MTIPIKHTNLKSHMKTEKLCTHMCPETTEGFYSWFVIIVNEEVCYHSVIFRNHSIVYKELPLIANVKQSNSSFKLVHLISHLSSITLCLETQSYYWSLWFHYLQTWYISFFCLLCTCIHAHSFLHDIDWCSFNISGSWKIDVPLISQDRGSLVEV